MKIEKITLSIMYSPWTIDTYSTFTFDHTIDYILEEENEKKQNRWVWYEDSTDDTPVSYDDYDWTYFKKEYVQALANNWHDLVQSHICDDVIKEVELTGEAYSPREYNFTTDDCEVTFTIDLDALDAYIETHRDVYEKDKIKSESGFIWLGNEEQTKLHFYLHHKSINDLTEDDYYFDTREVVDPYEFVEYKLIKVR